MPNILTLVLNDGAASPVAHSFVPVNTTGVSANWAERLTTGQMFWPTLRNDVIVPQKGDDSKPLVDRWQVKVPVSVTVNGVTTLDHFSSASVNFYFSPRASEQERKDLYAYVSNLLATANVKDAAVKVEPYY